MSVQPLSSPVEILPPPGSSGDDEEAVEWVASWEDVEVRKVGVTFKLGDDYVRCSKRFYSRLTPSSP